MNSGARSKGRHTFDFEGGEKLTTIGATFFVSYLYSQSIDSRHSNWERISTRRSRISTIKSSERYHCTWLARISSMSDANLSKNTLGLEGTEVKAMARAVLQKAKGPVCA